MKSLWIGLGIAAAGVGAFWLTYQTLKAKGASSSSSSSSPPASSPTIAPGEGADLKAPTYTCSMVWNCADGTYKNGCNSSVCDGNGGIQQPQFRDAIAEPKLDNLGIAVLQKPHVDTIERVNAADRW
ncbi:MAG: hypothetical protein K6T57_12315 [Thermaceae bacterium]|nr:hypothetical protein [Thermaceae bacterium]